MKLGTFASALLLIILLIQSDSALGGGRIYGGYQVDITKAPYMVFVTAIGEHHPDGTADAYSCGGTILKTNLILTAGHCTKNGTSGLDFQAEQFLINVGSNEELSGGVKHYVKKLHVHPNYRGPATHYHNDVAILELKEHIQLNNKAQLVTLAQKDDMPAVGTEGIVSGWGTNPEHEDDNRLYQVHLKVISAEKCVRLVGGDTVEERDKHEICADAKGKSFCEGDSGGPFIDVNTERQIGIVSWGIATCPKSPSIFCRVTDNLDFIEGVIRKTSRKFDFDLGKLIEGLRIKFHKF